MKADDDKDDKKDQKFVTIFSCTVKDLLNMPYLPEDGSNDGAHWTENGNGSNNDTLKKVTEFLVSSGNGNKKGVSYDKHVPDGANILANSLVQVFNIIDDYRQNELKFIFVCNQRIMIDALWEKIKEIKVDKIRCYGGIESKILVLSRLRYEK